MSNSGEESSLGERRVYGILGVPIDVDTQQEVLGKIAAAVVAKARFLISTPNLNFLVLSQSEPEFRRSLYLSDLCTPDGVPVVWIARILGVPVSGRIAGSDLFDALLQTPLLGRRLRIALFGGPDGVAKIAADKINGKSPHAACVAAISPGIGDLETLSSEQLISQINASKADLLSVSLGAQKGQAWLIQNDRRITTPVRIHLGATINFQAGTVTRAPRLWRNLGVEWLWRIKEEPQLFKRYWRDGCILLYLLVAKVLPLAVDLWWSNLRFGGRSLEIFVTDRDKAVHVLFSGMAVDRNFSRSIDVLRPAIERGKDVIFDLREVDAADSRFMGLVLATRELLHRSGLKLEVVSARPRVRRQFYLNGFSHLLQ